MELYEESKIVSLLDTEPELKKLYDEHQAFEKQLAEFQHKNHLTTDEEVEMKRLQKLKLAGRDKIMELVSKHR